LFRDENERELRKLDAEGSRKIYWQTPTRAFKAPFTIANATTLTKGGHAAKTSD